jgi:uncharacterized protein YlxP (DUF503 family)
MAIGILTIEILIPNSASLKEKRMVLNRLKDKSRKFNISIAETGYQDKWQRSEISIVTVSAAPSHVQETLDKIFRFLDEDFTFEINKHKIEYV